MNRHQQIRHHLNDIERTLRQADLWQTSAPAPEALNSSEPFCVDTLAPLEWLQWILLPRLHALLDSHGPLPQNFAVTPYYEVALTADIPARMALLLELSRLDALFVAGVAS